MRGGVGEERYEDVEIQKRVRRDYNLLMDQTWSRIDTSHLTRDEVVGQVHKLIDDKLQVSDLGPVRQLWQNQLANGHSNGH